jgi:FKBP-type peptidyl-prolyl cis-trans isomerase FklB
MKKLSIVAALAIAAASFTACNNSATKADLKTELDTLSYAIGMAQTNGLKDYLVQRVGVDTAYMDDFLKGVNEGVNAGDDKKKNAYIAGLQIGQQISTQMVKGTNHELFGNDSTQTISLKNFMAGFSTAVLGGKGVMTTEQAIHTVQTKMDKIKAVAMEKQYGDNKKKCEEFVANYAKKDGVKKLDKGVLYTVIKEGNCPLPKDTSMVTLQYEGKLIDGTVFDSSYQRGKAVPMRVNQVIPGFTEALLHMPVGSVWEVCIPQEQAYGAREAGKIKRFSALVFKIELVALGTQK